MQQELEELLQFLQLGARLDLKVLSLSNVLSKFVKYCKNKYRVLTFHMFQQV